MVSPEHLFRAWDAFKADKRKKIDVLEFERNLEPELFKLHRELRDHAYRHGPYASFYIRDPKLRHIHKAAVRDRVLHHAVFRAINPIFEPTFIPASFSCRAGKGAHKGVTTVAAMLRGKSRNTTRPCWVLKCDIRKFFDSIDHDILIGMLSKRIKDADAMRLLREIIESFAVNVTLFERKGVPIGNLTSQLFANIYLNEFDQFVKHALKVQNYARYTDDFVVVSQDRDSLAALIAPMRNFLRNSLHLDLHPGKVFIRKYFQGIDFLGYVMLPHHTVLRTKTRRRMFRKVRERVVSFKDGITSESSLNAAMNSYHGVLSHANAHGVRQELDNRFWFWRTE